MSDPRDPSPPPAPPANAPRRLPSPRVLKYAVIGLLVAGAVAFLLKGANEPDDPSFASGNRRPVEGFGEIAYRINKTAQQSRCALLAQSDQQRSRGLMNRSDLSGYDGMLFVFPADTSSTFYMKDTPLALSIAWFDEAGRFVSSTDMQPCLNRPDCPLYAATGPYRYALEVAQGGLPALGIGPGSLISVGGPCA
ncbi:MAG: DUF192 domain-containing protein [Acidimicrobiales bacterium]